MRSGSGKRAVPHLTHPIAPRCRPDACGYPYVWRACKSSLGLRLGGPNRYGDRVEVRPYLGEGRPAEVDDIARVVRLSRDVTVALGLALTAPALGAKVLHERTRHTGRSARRRRRRCRPRP